MKLLVSGGGTGGHFFPAFEILKKAHELEIETLYVGTLRGIESEYKKEIPGDAVFLETYPFRNTSLKKKIKSTTNLIKAVYFLNSEIKEDFLTIIFGGYSSLPAGILTLLHRKSLFIHEQNSVPSLTNKTLSVFARKVFISFEYTRNYIKGSHVIKTGTPVREEILRSRKEKKEARKLLHLDTEGTLILFMGGSQGARFINNLALDFVRKTNIRTLLITGKRDFPRIKETAHTQRNLKIIPFSNNMGLIYSAVDIAVCRSGAGTIGELSAFGIPALFIPYPYATDDHQFYNAKEIEELGGAFVLRESEASLEKVVKLVERIQENIESMGKSIKKFYSPRASTAILKEIFNKNS